MTHLCTIRGRGEPIQGRHRCEAETSRGQCSKWATGVVIYPYGAVALCEKHLAEECGEESAQ